LLAYVKVDVLRIDELDIAGWHIGGEVGHKNALRFVKTVEEMEEGILRFGGKELSSSSQSFFESSLLVGDLREAGIIELGDSQRLFVN
jgi:hypothetical protein